MLLDYSPGLNGSERVPEQCDLFCKINNLIGLSARAIRPYTRINVQTYRPFQALPLRVVNTGRLNNSDFERGELAGH